MLGLKNLLTACRRGYVGIILLRHVERSEYDGIVPFDARLSDRGVQTAIEFGRRTKGYISSVKTSPVHRCQQTARHIIQGSGSHIPYVISEVLGDPGAFVYDAEEAGSYITAHGVHGFMDKLIHGPEGNGIRKRHEGVKILTSFIKDTLKNLTKGKAAVFVTHDSIIAPLVCEWFNVDTISEAIPDYLDGIYIISSPLSISASFKQYYKVLKKSSDSSSQ